MKAGVSEHSYEWGEGAPARLEGGDGAGGRWRWDASRSAAVSQQISLDGSAIASARVTAGDKGFGSSTRETRTCFLLHPTNPSRACIAM